MPPDKRSGPPTTAARSNAETLTKEPGGLSVGQHAYPPDVIRCDFAGILCGVLGWHQREAAGRARLCCRNYLYGYGEDGD